MSNYIPPGDKSDGQIIFGADWNTLKNGLASYLNNGNIGNAQITSNPAEKIAESKLDLTAPTGSHSSRHEPGGADEVNDIDILDTGTLLSAHASRHADGGADPIPAASITNAMLKDQTIPNSKLRELRDADSVIAAQLALTFAQAGVRRFNMSPATIRPRGRGVVRSGKVYFSAPAAAPDAIIRFDIATETFSVLPMDSGDEPSDLLLIGTDIYVLCEGSTTGTGVGSPSIKKLDVSEVFSVFLRLNADGTGSGDYDRVFSLICNDAKTILYCCPKRTGTPQPHQIARIAISGADLTHLYDAGSTAEFGRIHWVKNGTSEYIVVVDGRDAGGTASTLIRRLASDLTAVDTLSLGTANDYQPHLAVFDGLHLVVLDNDGSSNLHVFNVTQSALFEVSNLGANTSGIAAAGHDRCFFDGRHVWLATTTATPQATAVKPREYGGATPMLVSAVGAQTVNGFATDGVDLYIVASNGATGDAMLIKMRI